VAATVFVSTIPLFSFVQRRPSKVRIAQHTSCQASRHFIPAVTVNAQRRVATACLIINRVDLTGVVSCPFATALYEGYLGCVTQVNSAMDISQINTSVCSRGSAPAPWTYTATRRIANQYERCVFVPHNGAAEGNFFLRRMCTPDCSLTDRWWHGARGSACNIRLLSPHVCDRPDCLFKITHCLQVAVRSGPGVDIIPSDSVHV
jgi:hypothetical protein